MKPSTLAFLATVLIALRSTLAAYQDVPVWQVAARSELSISGLDTDFHRVQAAALLPGNRLVVADAGNSRLLFFSSQGVLQRTAGRKGSGPGEFQSLWTLQALGDTVVTYDSGLNRVSLWIDATLAETISIPPYQQRVAEVQAALTPHDFIAVTLEPFQQRGGGLYVDTVTVLHYDGRTQRYAPLGRREWRYLYLYGQSNGHTTYRTPFLPSSKVVASGGEAVFVPMSGAEAHILSPRGRDTISVSLPIPLKPFDRSVVTSYRDSLLKLPGSEGPAANRLRDVFGSRFPAPANAPRVRAAVGVGPNVWIQTQLVDRQRRSQWYVVNPKDHRIVGRAWLPLGWQLLGGDDTRLIVLHKDELDLESVAIYRVQHR